jgi:hypothetical protein
MTVRADSQPYYRKAAILLVLFLLVGLVGVHFRDGALGDGDSSAGIARSAPSEAPQGPPDSSLLRGYTPDATLQLSRHATRANVVSKRRGHERSSAAVIDTRAARRLHRPVGSSDGWVGLIP